MSDNQNWINTGELMKDALSEALNTGDFKELNNLVAQSVTTALNEVGVHINTQINQNQPQRNSADKSAFQPDGTGQQTNIPVWQQRAWERERKKQARIQQENNTTQNDLTVTRQNAMLKFPAVKMKRVGKVSNVLYQVFGGIGLGITGFVTLIRLFVFLSGDTTLAGWIINFIFLSIFYGMVKFGLGQKHRLKRAVRYVQLCGQKMYEDIENLAKAVGKNVRFVTKDLRKMLDMGFFPEGHIDQQGTCLMLNDTIYRQYLETENSLRRIEEKNRPALAQNEDIPSPEQQTSQETSDDPASELDTIIAEGMECIRKLRDLNDRISGEAISAKLFRLENLLKELFDSLREHPEQMHRMHKLMNYYLPTTLKLVEAYEDFDRISSPGQEIIKAKAEIENTLDTINQAFTELLNNLFQDTVFDVTTDAQVLKTMLAREGLMREMELVPNSQEQTEPKQPQYLKE